MVSNQESRTNQERKQQNVFIKQQTSVKIQNKVVDLKEMKDLYSRLMVPAKSSRGIDQKNAIRNYEFTVTPSSFFAPNGELLPCVDRSKLIHALEIMSLEV